MSPNTPRDELLERYAHAKAQLPDGLPSEPPAALHERIMRSAREQVVATDSIALHADSIPATSPKSLKNSTLKDNQPKEAANDSFWNIKAVASIAVMGLSALIWWQFEQGTPAEQEAAKTASTPATRPATVAITPQAAPAATAGAPAPLPPAAADTTAQDRPQVFAQAPKKPAPVIAAEQASPPAQVERARSQDLASATPAPTPNTAPRSEAATPHIANAETATSDSAARSDAPRMPAAARARKEINAETANSPSVASAPTPAPAPRAAALSKATAPNPLLQAIQERNTAALRQALEQGASPNMRTPEGNPALTQAVIQNWAEGVRILLAAKANKGAKNSQNLTAAEVAQESGHQDIIELLKAER